MSKETEHDSSEAAADIDETLGESGAKVAARLPFLGHVTWLAARSSAHRLLFLQDLEWRVMPPLMLEQFKLYFDRRASGLPVAYVSWAYLSETAERDFVAHQRIAPDAWNSGNRLWLVDFMTPFGGVKSIFNDIHGAVHKSRDVNLIYASGGSTPRPTTLSRLFESKRPNPGTVTSPTRH